MEHPYTLSLTREIAAPRKHVWRCWTEPALFEQWYCPKPWQVSDAVLSLRPGGPFNMVMNGPEGERMELVGIYLEVVPQERLIFTDAYREGFFPQPQSFMTGCVEFTDSGEGTQMVWTARHANEEAVKQHLEMGFEQGWNASADQLEALAKTL